MTTTTAIASNAAAANSSIISVAAGATIQVYSDIELTGEEKVQLERTYNAGSNFVSVKVTKEGNFIFNDTVLDKKIASNAVSGPGEFRLTKTATSVAIAIFVDS